MKEAATNILISMLALLAPLSAGCTDDLELPAGEPDTLRGVATAADGQTARSQMEAYLADRYATADVVHSFTQRSGVDVDCVRREGQPSLRGAAARGRAIAAPPPFSAPGAAAPGARDGAEAFLAPGDRDDKGAERLCPVGTVPIQRTTIADLVRFPTLADRMRSHPPAGQGLAWQRLGSSERLQYASAQQRDRPNHGAHSRINVWSPYVEVASEVSANRLTVWSGSGADLQWVDVGAMTNPNLFGTWRSHLFVSSASDPYGDGCFNLDCPRFVQVDGRVVLGGMLPASVPGGTQYEIETSLRWWQGNWWVGIDGIWVGYYPGSLFHAAGLAFGAEAIDAGGVIVDDRAAHPNRHTETDLGSGAFPAAWYRRAAYQRDLWYWADATRTYYLTGMSPSPTDAFCYDISFHTSSDPTWRTYLFMGGSGYNPSCL